MKQVLTITLLFVVLGCGEMDKTTTDSPAAPLQKQLGNITLTYSDQHFPTETPLEIKLSHVALGTSVQGKIVGTNMAMGTIPLFFTPTSDGQWSGQFMLGACTEPVMHWKLQLQFTSADGSTSTLEDTFDVVQR